MAKKGEIKDRIGEKYTTNEGYEVEILEYFKWDNCTIRFKNGTIVKNVQYSNIKTGKIKNPYHPSVYGVGYIGVYKYSKKAYLKIYATWSSMLQRCYDHEYQKRQPSYKECSVEKSWHNFQNYAKWYEENYKLYMKRWQLDKDVLVKGNKIYSPENCCFVPSEVNCLFTKSNSRRGKLPIGVCMEGNNFLAQININGEILRLKTFKTPEKAFQAYKVAKEARIKEMADKWRGKIAEKVYQAMYNYTVEITD